MKRKLKLTLRSKVFWGEGEGDENVWELVVMVAQYEHMMDH